MAIEMKAPACPYCGRASEKVKGDRIYPHRPDLYAKTFYLCEPCGAYVGCHPGGEVPLGRLADAELRSAKSAAHSAFDPLWKTGRMGRRSAYKWLAKHLGISSESCHIGMFDLETCRRVIEICAERRAPIPEVNKRPSIPNCPLIVGQEYLLEGRGYVGVLIEIGENSAKVRLPGGQIITSYLEHLLTPPLRPVRNNQ